MPQQDILEKLLFAPIYVMIAQILLLESVSSQRQASWPKKKKKKKGIIPQTFFNYIDQ